MKACGIQVFGKVQGVYFRQSTRDKAIALGLQGFVRNEPDGSVYMEAEGSETALQQLEQWCHKGPVLAKVERIIVTGRPPAGFSGFEIRR